MERFKYGELVKDSVTGFEGKVTGVIDNFGFRPRQYRVEALGDGHPITWTIDENRIEPVNACKCKSAVYLHETA